MPLEFYNFYIFILFLELFLDEHAMVLRYFTWLVNTTPHYSHFACMEGRVFPQLSSQTLQVNQFACMTLITYRLGIAQNTEIKKNPRKKTQQIPNLLFKMPHQIW